MRLLEREEIDDRKWNATIAAASHSLPYGYTWYLDSVCRKWKAFVADDYSAVMPIPFARKFFLPYCYQPFFCQQLGVFYTKKNETLFLQWLLEMRRLFVLADYQFNASWHFAAVPGIREKTNLLLPLRAGFAELQSGFSQNTKRNMSKAEKAGLIVNAAPAAAFRLPFYLEHTASRDKNFKKTDRPLLEALLHQLESRQLLQWFDCSRDGKVLAMAGVVTHGSRRIHLLPATHPEGRDLGAMHLLTANIIANYSEQPLVYDFEGSSVPSIARFYKGFGAVEETYQALSLKRKIFRKGGNTI